MKNMITRVTRTFLQAAIGSIAANLTLYAAGICDGEPVKNVLITLLTAALASGLAAVMNLPRKGGKTGDADGSDIPGGSEAAEVPGGAGASDAFDVSDSSGGAESADPEKEKPSESSEEKNSTGGGTQDGR